jgi:hypothetical protein
MNERSADRERLARLDTRMVAEQYWGSLKELHADCRFLRRLLREAEEREEDELSMALCAIRYCMGRATYIVADGIKWARHYGAISPWLRGVVIKDLESSVAQLDRSRSRGAVPQLMCLGHDVDEREWRRLLSELRDMEAERAGR